MHAILLTSTRAMRAASAVVSTMSIAVRSNTIAFIPCSRAMACVRGDKRQWKEGEGGRQGGWREESKGKCAWQNVQAPHTPRNTSLNWREMMRLRDVAAVKLRSPSTRTTRMSWPRIPSGTMSCAFVSPTVCVCVPMCQLEGGGAVCGVGRGECVCVRRERDKIHKIGK